MNDLDAERATMQQGAPVPLFVGATTIMAPQHQLEQDVYDYDLEQKATLLTSGFPVKAPNPRRETNLGSKQIIKVLPTCTSTLYESNLTCSDSTQKTAREEALNKLNDVRKTVATGMAASQNGAIPAAGNMYKLIYDCDLEEMSSLMVSGCPSQTPTITRAINLAKLDQGKTIVDAVVSWEELLTQNPVQWPANNILPDVTKAYYPYATTVNSNATAVGCAKMDCNYNGVDKTVVGCVFDVPALAKDSEIYATGRACSDCTVYTPSTCDGSLCVRTQPTTPAPTTEAPTTEAPTTAAPPTAAPTTAAPATAPPTTMGTGGSTNCSPEQSEQLRQRVVDMINYRRDQLAQGKVAKNNGALLPNAANMLKITYNCPLEVAALTFAKTCSITGSNLLGKSENFHRTTGSDMVQAAAVSTRFWWKQVRLVPGIGVRKVTFRQKHESSTIRFFTLMAWATVNQMGCGVAQCGNVYNVVCRYSPPGNIVESQVYQIGRPASACPSGTRADATYTALCA
ncbi:hypothetical protein Q1695_008346 [Nippostrongylus brasiliensis]|nr:hypothetical protein Q1695_008346 [Nippostrongylus brasiliensis]